MMSLFDHDGRRRTHGRIAAGSAILLAAASASAVAAQDGAAPPASDIQSLIEQLKRQQTEIDSLRGEVTALRASNDEKWMTEQRAGEIRSLIADVLADADGRASMLQDGLTAGHDGNFFLASQDGRFLLELAGQMQLRWFFNWHDAPDEYRMGFENTRTKLTFSGHVFNPDLTYLVRMDVTRNEPGLVTGLFFLQDAWVRYNLNNDWSIRGGQFKVPFNREELISSAHQLTVERSLVNESLNLGRTQGVELTWAGEHLRVSGATGDGATDSVGGFGIIDPGGEPLNSNALNEDVELAFHGRFDWKLAGTWDQFMDFTSPLDDPMGVLLGGAVHFQKGENGSSSGGNRQEEWVGYTVDLSLEFGGANLFFAWVHHMIDSPDFASSPFEADIFGAVVQGGVYFTPQTEVFARYEWGQFVTHLNDTAFKTLHLATVGVNYYLDGHDAKFTADMGFSFERIDGAFDSEFAGWRADGLADNQLVIRTQFQLLF
jgi:hypothetical protein